MKLFGIEFSFYDRDTQDMLAAITYERHESQQAAYVNEWDTSDADIDVEQGRKAILDTMQERQRLRAKLEQRGWTYNGDGTWKERA